MDQKNKLRLKILVDGIIKDNTLVTRDPEPAGVWYHAKSGGIDNMVQKIIDLIEREINVHTG